MAKRRKKRRSGTKILVGILVAVLVVLLLLLGVFFYLLTDFYSRSQYIADDKVELMTLPPEEEETALESGEAQKLIEENKLTTEESAEEKADEGFYNLLLIGADRRDGTGWDGNSDTIILLTVNRYTKTISLTSFMRDLYANIPNVGVRKLNHSYAIGGGPLLAATMKANYGITVDNYAAVDFKAMEAIVDICGGVDISIKDYEIGYIDGVTAAGKQHLNGSQAVSYMRLRYAGDADFERTQRQRRVLQAMYHNMRNFSVSDVISFLKSCLPYIQHNITQSKLTSLLTEVPTLLGYESEELRMPADGEYHIVNEMLIPNDINAAMSGLKARIYRKQ